MSDLPGNAADILRLFDAAPIAMCHLAGRDLRVRAVNPTCREVLGLGSAAIGEPAREILMSSLGPDGMGTILSALDTGKEQRLLHAPEGVAEDGTPLSRAFDFVVVPDGPRQSAHGVLLFGRPMRFMGQEAYESPESPDGISARERVQCAEMTSELRRSSGPASTPVTAYGAVSALVTSPAGHVGIGGDWFECHVAADGALGIVIGDVGRRGVAATSAAARLRAVARERLTAGAGPLETLDALHRDSRRDAGCAGSAAAVALFRPESGRLEVALRGFPPLLLVTSDGVTSYLGAIGSAPLGLIGPVTSESTIVDGGAVLLACSDSIVARPGTDVHMSLAHLGEWLSREHGSDLAAPGPVPYPLSELNRDVVRRRPGPPAAGSLVVSARLQPYMVAAFEDRLPLNNLSAVVLRDSVSAWMTRVGLVDEHAFAVTRAVDQVVDALLETRESETSLHVLGDLGQDGTLTLTLTAAPTQPKDEKPVPRGEFGEDVPPPLADARTLMLMLGLVEGMHSSSLDGSSIVVLTWTLTNPTDLDEPLGDAFPEEAPCETFLTTAEGERTVTVTGGVTDSVDAMRLAVLAIRRDRSLAIDLSQVEGDVGSEAIEYLHALAREDGMTLVAAAGSSAHTALTLSGIPCRSASS